MDEKQASWVSQCVCVDLFLALQLGFVYPSIIWVASAVLSELAPVVALLLVSLPRIIPWVSSVDIMSTDEFIEYSKGITSSHFAVGGIDLMIIPLQVLSVIAGVLRLSTATFLVQSSLTWSWISVPLTNTVRLSASCAWDHRMLVLFPHSFWIESQA